jgi:hypothetical protein
MRATDAGAGDVVATARARPVRTSACAGHRSPLPRSLFFALEAGAFPGSGRPDVGVHVPPGFDATGRAGLVVYFHGWNGCVQAALDDRDVPCSDSGEGRPASHLASQLDDARVNALLVAVELRADMATGETGQLAAPGGLRALLRELFDAHLGAALGAPGGPCSLPVDGFERVMLVAHSGGYQALASALAMGDLPRVTDIVLLDALYGADDVFASWTRDALDGFHPSRRFVDLYTCCGGTLERSRTLASLADVANARAGDSRVFDDDGDADLDPSALRYPLVFKRVPAPHGALPPIYLRTLLAAAGFPSIPTEPPPSNVAGAM